MAAEVLSDIHHKLCGDSLIQGERGFQEAALHVQDAVHEIQRKMLPVVPNYLRFGFFYRMTCGRICSNLSVFWWAS
jgi:hypothetical protein